MIQDVFSIDRNKVGEVTLPEPIFGVKPNPSLLAQALRVWDSQVRGSLTGKTKTRAEVRGGGIKPRPQKGSGRSRQGSIRSPLWVGGGIAHGPKPNRVLRLNRKMNKAALIGVLSLRAQAGALTVLEQSPKGYTKTKKLADAFAAFGEPGYLMVLAEDDHELRRVACNLPWLNIMPVASLNFYAVLKQPALIITQEALPALVKKLSKDTLSNAASASHQKEDLLEGLGLSSRPLNALKKAGFFRVSEISKLSTDELAEIKGLGKSSVIEIQKLLKGN